jgi:hypothetical protein
VRDASFFVREKNWEDGLSRSSSISRLSRMRTRHCSAILDTWNPDCRIVGRFDAVCREIAAAVGKLGRFRSRRRRR